MNTHLLKPSGGRSRSRALSFIRCIAILFAMLTLLPRNTYAGDNIREISKLAEQGDVEAQCKLGFCYAEGKGVTKNLAEAIKWYRKAAEQGNAPAQSYLGYCYNKGKGVTKNLAEAIKWYRKAAEQGNAPAQFNLGCCYDKGEGVAKDHSEAAKWYRKAAEQGDGDAQFNLGCCYDKGEGVAKDHSEAAKWYRKAAEQGDGDAQFNLGCCYDKGEGVTKDHSEAAKWYRKAAEQGYAPAQFNLGVCYAGGKGVTQTPSEAAKWYRKAAEQGLAPAQFYLGLSYYQGYGVPQDYTEAVRWFRLAAEQQDADAQFALGLCYENGYGVRKDTTEATKWYQLAAKQGHTGAKDKLASCEKMKLLDEEFNKTFRDMKESRTAESAREKVNRLRMIWTDKMLHLSGCALCRAGMGNNVKGKIAEADDLMQKVFNNLEKASDQLAAKQGHTGAKDKLASCEELKLLNEEFNKTFRDMKESWTAASARGKVNKMRMIWTNKMLHLSGCALCRAGMGNNVKGKIAEADDLMQRVFNNLEKASDPRQTYDKIKLLIETTARIIPLLPLLM